MAFRFNSALALTAVFALNATARADGFLRGWGQNDGGQLDVPADLGPIQDIALGGQWALAVKPDGTVRGWGNNESGAITIPSWYLPAVAVIGRGSTSGVRRSDGVTRFAGRICLGGATNEFAPGLTAIAQSGGIGIVYPAGSTSGAYLAGSFCCCGSYYVPGNFSDIDLGWDHVVALRPEGAVTCAGGNDFGQRNVPVALPPCRDVAAGAGFSVAVTASGDVVCWGRNQYGQCDVPTTAVGVVEVVTGGEHCVARRSDGAVICWGRNSEGQCNVPKGVGPATKVVACFNSSMAVFQSPDADRDGIPFGVDNCPGVSNPSQADCDSDGIGDACESDSDCNLNGALDNCEIASGQATDHDRNGVPDVCQCLSDLFADGRVDGADLGILLSLWGPASSSGIADIDRSGNVDGADLGYLLSQWGACP